MGACGSSEVVSEDTDQKKRSQAIDRKLEEDSKKLKRECKILLLGSGESGKSTIVKQMKIIHQNGYTQEERALYRLTIYKNLIDCMKSLVAAMLHQFEIAPNNEKVLEYCQFIEEYNADPDPDALLDPRVEQAVTTIWADDAARKTMKRSSEFYLMDSAP
ncbi:Guanine nucleotide-binding protein alpha-2 subunit [Elasticomyces elasticus]|nr:Guanine nucleotide-binding protein alpha-2 subunit [Elasticomyces elasticus]